MAHTNVNVELPAGVYKAAPLLAPETASPVSRLRTILEERRALRDFLEHATAGEVRTTLTVPQSRLPGDVAHDSNVCCRHTAQVESCYAIRTAAAEKALRCLQRENDCLKQTEIDGLRKQRQMREVIARLMAELEAMGGTVADHTTTLRTLSLAMERHDPYNLVKQKRAIVSRHGAAMRAVTAELKEVCAARDEWRLKCEAAENLTTTLQKEIERVRAQLPKEAIDTTEDDGPSTLHADLIRMMDALDGQCVRWEQHTAGETVSPPTVPLYRVQLRVLNCGDLVRRTKNTNLNPFVVIRGPVGDRVLLTTAVQFCTSAPSFEADGVCEFHVIAGTSWRLHVDVRCAADDDDKGVVSTLVGSAVVPVSALLANLRSQQRKYPHHVDSATSLHTVSLSNGEIHSDGYVCLEAVVTVVGPREGPSRPALVVTEAGNMSHTRAITTAPAEAPMISVKREVETPTSSLPPTISRASEPTSESRTLRQTPVHTAALQEAPKEHTVPPPRITVTSTEPPLSGADVAAKSLPSTPVTATQAATSSPSPSASTLPSPSAEMRTTPPAATCVPCSPPQAAAEESPKLPPSTVPSPPPPPASVPPPPSACVPVPPRGAEEETVPSSQRESVDDASEPSVSTPPPATVPLPPTAAVPQTVTHEEPKVAVDPELKVAIRVHVVEGCNLEHDGDSLQLLGSPAPRVQAWRGDELLYTVPAAHSSRNQPYPSWTEEEGCFFVTDATLEDRLVFMVQDVNMGDVVPMGNAQVTVKELLEVAGERTLPVYLQGQDRGHLKVNFKVILRHTT